MSSCAGVDTSGAFYESALFTFNADGTTLATSWYSPGLGQRVQTTVYRRYVGFSGERR